MFIDSHCHLDKIDLADFGGDFAQLIDTARAADVERMLCIGVTLEEFPAMAELVADYEDIYLSCGVHPLYVAKHPLQQHLLRDLAKHERVVAIGETGLDYYYDADSKKVQQESFAYHIELANELHKPLIIHTRDAREDTLSMLKEGGAERCGGVLHCFTESLEMAQRAIDELGFYISISGIASFRSATELREVVQAIPLQHLLIETDSPWLAPVPHRGKQNHPALVADVAKCVADIKGCSLAEVAAVTKNNFFKLFQGAN
ncbi:MULTISPECIES: TatD family hydrolase [Pseudidiomarina]|uniref:TatD DNase family protein n=3 Tax=Pseudidiomarina TaxID=2800384 RepID=A0A368V254_9GAMM|nr:MULTISPECIES: TatD family hydrolase [Pseudidiomarina]PWW15192.1 TatD DNase family protein [Pseudidiomarina maritima]RBP89616.1 TatD DNase family protein [Pseudidiomarina tainanensis]RCW35166.1 TatD DNase family protein [Pseudidiomarina tainanensis]